LLLLLAWEWDERGDEALGGCHDAVIFADAVAMGGSSPLLPFFSADQSRSMPISARSDDKEQLSYGLTVLHGVLGSIGYVCWDRSSW